MDNEQTEVKKLYNGNIAETRWRTNFDNLTRSYGYTYDELNRLTNAQYVRPSNPNNPNPADIIDTFNEKLSYDKNGNIQSLVRNGGMESQTTVPIMDVLTYQYDANTKNKLIKVTDATANTEGFKDGADTTEEYGYDPNGNMTRDDNKNIQSIVYNHLNLPTKIVFQNGGDFPSISYLYTATGKKVAKTVNIASRNTINYTVDYLDGYQYESGKLLFFPTAEGYVKYTEGIRNPFDYIFNYTDHLGNIRLSYGINPETGMLTKIEENNYYPFGLKHGSYNTEAKIIVKHQPINGLETGSLDKLMVQKTDVLAEEMERPPLSTNSNPEFYSGYNYKFQEQERQEDLGLNWDSFKWRNYDYAIGRFMCIDPLAEKYAYNSTYAFQENKMGMGRELEGLELGGAAFNNYSAEFTRSLAGALDNMSAKVSAFFSVSRDIAPNTKVETTTTATAGTNFLNYINQKQFDQSSPVSLFTAKVETKVELKVTVADVKAKVEGINVGVKVTNATNVTTGVNKTEVKGIVGVGSNGIFVTNTTNNSTGQNTTRAGVQIQAETPKIQGTTFKVGMSASMGQEEKKKSN